MPLTQHFNRQWTNLLQFRNPLDLAAFRSLKMLPPVRINLNARKSSTQELALLCGHWFAICIIVELHLGLN